MEMNKDDGQLGSSRRICGFAVAFSAYQRLRGEFILVAA
jgi:hypothetical protein